MGVFSGPEINEDGLVLVLDAANTKSYGGSGTTWTDLSGKGNNGTLTNGPLHSQGPFLGAGYVTFDGTNDYLTTTYSTSEFRWWDTDYTIEAWIYPTTLTDWYSGSARSALVGNIDHTGNTNYWSFGPYNSSGNVKFYYWNGSPQDAMVSTESVTANSWNHIAFIKNSSGCKIFVNGVGTDYMAISGTPQDSTSFNLIVGAYYNSDINGYVSNLRIVKGTALYTSNFTPTKSSLENISNTKLLTCQGSSITDASDSSHTINVSGNAAAVYNDVSYFTFDASNDYVSHSNDSFVSNGGATLECWFNIDTLSADRALINHSGFLYFNLLRASNNKLRVEYKSTSGNNTQLFTTSTISTGSWYHVVAVVNSTGARIYINGELDASNSTPQNLGTVSSTLYVGGYDTSQYLFDGKIAMVKRYNKPLTAAEVKQNFNVFRVRYGI